MDAGEDIVSPPYALEDVAPPPNSAFSLRVVRSSALMTQHTRMVFTLDVRLN